jgi:hypothetical protein
MGGLSWPLKPASVGLSQGIVGYAVDLRKPAIMDTEPACHSCQQVKTSASA